MRIVLIGPIGAGKSTIAPLLARQLGISNYSLDEIRWLYFKETNYDKAVSDYKRMNEGMWSLYRYWQPFEVYAVERILTDYPDSVIDFGATQSVCEDNALFHLVQQALFPHPNVILLLPSPDIEKSIQILNGVDRDLSDEIRSLNEYLFEIGQTMPCQIHLLYRGENACDDTSCEILSVL